MEELLQCEYEGRCLNGPKNCFRCFDYSHLKLPEDRKRERNARKAQTMSGTSKLKPWAKLEERIARDLNRVPTAREMEARRNPGSGNQWHRPADVLDEVLLPEAKYRHVVNARGEQVYTVTKETLEKTIHEAAGTGKFPCHCFQFKGDDRVYVTFDWDVLVDLVTEYKYLKQENERLRQELLRLTRS